MLQSTRMLAATQLQKTKQRHQAAMARANQNHLFPDHTAQRLVVLQNELHDLHRQASLLTRANEILPSATEREQERLVAATNLNSIKHHQACLMSKAAPVQVTSTMAWIPVPNATSRKLTVTAR